jgi:hypothetical protein
MRLRKVCESRRRNIVPAGLVRKLLPVPYS